MAIHVEGLVANPTTCLPIVEIEELEAQWGPRERFMHAFLYVPENHCRKATPEDLVWGQARIRREEKKDFSCFTLRGWNFYHIHKR